jgi:peptidyl-prolyl cis-trans isomerase C
MIKFGQPRNSAGPRAVRNRAIGIAAVALGLLGLVAAAPSRAADQPTAPSPSPQQQAPSPEATMNAIIDMLNKNGSHVAVRLGDIPITQSDAAEYIRTMPISMAALGFDGVFHQAMDALIRQKMMLLDARKEGVDKEPAVIRKTQIMAEKVVVDEWLTRKANELVTDQAMRARYARFVTGKPGLPEVRVRVLLVPTEAEANDLLGKLQQGGDFADLAKQFSKDPSAARGGDLGYLPQEALSGEVGAVGFAMSPGQMTAYPLRAPAGFFLLRVEGRRQRPPMTFEEARPALERAERAEAVTTVILKLSDEIKVVTAADAAAQGDPAKK